MKDDKNTTRRVWRETEVKIKDFVCTNCPDRKACIYAFDVEMPVVIQGLEEKNVC